MYILVFSIDYIQIPSSVEYALQKLSIHCCEWTRRLELAVSPVCQVLRGSSPALLRLSVTWGPAATAAAAAAGARSAVLLWRLLGGRRSGEVSGSGGEENSMFTSRTSRGEDLSEEPLSLKYEEQGACQNCRRERVCVCMWGVQLLWEVCSSEDASPHPLPPQSGLSPLALLTLVSGM